MIILAAKQIASWSSVFKGAESSWKKLKKKQDSEKKMKYPRTITGHM